MTESRSDPIESFIEQMGLITQAEGGPRIAGRIFGLLIVEEGPLALHDVAARLSISKASASTNARMLAQRGLIRLRARSGDRQDYYELVPNPYQHMLDAVAERMRKNAAQIAETESQFPERMAVAKERIRQLAEFYRVSAEFLADWSDQLGDGRLSSDLSRPGAGPSGEGEALSE